MPRPRLVRALAYHHPGPHQADPDLPRREMWVERAADGIAALTTHPVYQLAPLHPEIRKLMVHPGLQRRIMKDVRFTKDGPIEALIWCPRWAGRFGAYRLAEPPGSLYDPYRPHDPDNLFTDYDHWIGMTRNRVWTTGGGDRDHLVLGAYVHLLARLDPHGDPLPAEPQGAIPDADEDALGTLAP